MSWQMLARKPNVWARTGYFTEKRKAKTRQIVVVNCSKSIQQNKFMFFGIIKVSRKKFLMQTHLFEKILKILLRAFDFETVNN